MATTELELTRTLTDVLEDELYHLKPSCASEAIAENHAVAGTGTAGYPANLLLSHWDEHRLSSFDWTFNRSSFSSGNSSSRGIFNKYADPSLTTTTIASNTQSMEKKDGRPPVDIHLVNSKEERIDLPSPITNTINLQTVSESCPNPKSFSGSIERPPIEDFNYKIKINQSLEDEMNSMYALQDDEENMMYCDDDLFESKDKSQWSIDENEFKMSNEDAKLIFDHEFALDDDDDDDEDEADNDFVFDEFANSLPNAYMHNNSIDPMESIKDINPKLLENGLKVPAVAPSQAITLPFDIWKPKFPNGVLPNYKYLDSPYLENEGLPDEDDDEEEESESCDFNLVKQEEIYPLKTERSTSFILRDKNTSESAPKLLEIPININMARGRRRSSHNNLQSTSSLLTSKVTSTSSSNNYNLRKKLGTGSKKSGFLAETNLIPKSGNDSSTPSTSSSQSPSSPSNTSAESSPSIKSSTTSSGQHRDHHEIYICTLFNNSRIPCGAKFSRSYDLTRHQNTIHAKKKAVFRCSECIGQLGDEGYQKTFSRLDALTRHIKSKHENLSSERRQEVTKYAKANMGYAMG